MQVASQHKAQVLALGLAQGLPLCRVLQQLAHLDKVAAGMGVAAAGRMAAHQFVMRVKPGAGLLHPGRVQRFGRRQAALHKGRVARLAGVQAWRLAGYGLQPQADQRILQGPPVVNAGVLCGQGGGRTLA